MTCGKSAKGIFIAPKQFVGVIRQVSRKDCCFGFSIKNLSCYCLAGNGQAKDTGKLLTSSPYHCLAGCANGRKGNNIDMRPDELSLCRCTLGQTLKDSFKTVVTRVMEMIRLSGS